MSDPSDKPSDDLKKELRKGLMRATANADQQRELEKDLAASTAVYKLTAWANTIKAEFPEASADELVEMLAFKRGAITERELRKSIARRRQRRITRLPAPGGVLRRLARLAQEPLPGL